MTVALLVTDEKEAPQLLPWAAELAVARLTDLVVIIPRKADQRQWKDIALPAGEKDSAIVKAVSATADAAENIHFSVEQPKENVVREPGSPAPISLKQLSDPDPGWALSEEIRNLNIQLLIIPANEPTKEVSWQQNLYRTAPCVTMYLRDDVHKQLEGMNVLVAITETPEDRVALNYASDIVKISGGRLTALFVEPETDIVAYLVGKKNLDRIVKSSLDTKTIDVAQRVVLADNLVNGIRKAEPSQYDFILLGSRFHREIRRVMFGKLFDGSPTKDVPAIGAIRSGMPLTNRVLMRFQHYVKRYIPQLDRQQRIVVVDGVTTGSKWNFDFVALMCLSTLIAGLGLIRDSAAVVIGAMLIAPMMSPLAGIGLGLAQENILLIKSATRTALRGFFTAYALSVVLGLSLRFLLGAFPVEASTLETNPVYELIMPTEMQSRGSPNFIDLIVALVSGVAGAYAMSRPKMLSALPGVAIAAALVPPIASSAMALAVFEWRLAGGALLLFLTNIVAIVLGATVTFWLVGIRSQPSEKPLPAWPRWLLLVNVLLAIALTALITFMNRS